MAAEKDLQKEVDRWRRMLEEAERELEAKAARWAKIQDLFFANTVKFAQVLGTGEGHPLSKAVTALRTVLDNESNITVVESGFAHLTHSLLTYDAKSLSSVNSKADIGSDQLCAVLISEILLQLLESVSLPTDVGHRIERLKQIFDRGTQNGVWNDMFDEVADMAADIKLKINHERVDTETFLKQVTDRLQDLDSFIQGTQQSRHAAMLVGKSLDDAFRYEMQQLKSGVDQTNEVSALKNVLQQRLGIIEQHLAGFHERETSRHAKESDEVKILTSRLAELEAETQKLREKIAKERKAAQIDTLTGIPNRLAYQERITQEYARWKRFKHPLSLVVWDVDHFKKINDGYGHATGDRVLQAIAKQLQGKIRETDLLARFGGEEFVLIMPGANTAAALAVAEKLRAAIEATPFHFRGKPVQVTISCGIAEFGENDTIDTVFERADSALYNAKQRGRNRVVVA